MGKSGRAILRAVVEGEDNPETLAKLARGRLKKKEAELVEAIYGTIGPHQRMILSSTI
jgi:transposase